VWQPQPYSLAMYAWKQEYLLEPPMHAIRAMSMYGDAVPWKVPDIIYLFFVPLFFFGKSTTRVKTI
jgi:hypothetical protein